MNSQAALKSAQEIIPIFSLLVASLNRAEPLRLLFESLAQQTCRDFEVLLADQNPPGFLDELLAEFHALPLRVIPVPPKGVSLARNALLPHARGTLIAFPDDDCRYRPDTLEQAAAFFAANPHVHALLGEWHDPAAGQLRPHGRRSGRRITRFSAFRRGGTLVQFYRKAVVDAVGGFDPELGPGTGLPYGCGEDTDYLLRALAAGFTVTAAPGVRLYHPDISCIPPPPEKIRAYALGRMHLLRKHGFPLWFKLAAVAYPLLRIPFEGGRARAYRAAMFLGRLAGLFAGGKK